MITGLERTMRQLQSLDKRAARSAVRKAANAGGTELTREVRRLAKTHRRTGALARAISKKTRSYQAGNIVVSIVGARVKKLPNGTNPGKYFHLVDEGTKPHIIRGILSFGGRVVRWVRHPGTRPKHMLRRASRSAGSRARKKALAKLQQEVTKALS